MPDTIRLVAPRRHHPSFDVAVQRATGTVVLLGGQKVGKTIFGFMAKPIVAVLILDNRSSLLLEPWGQGMGYEIEQRL